MTCYATSAGMQLLHALRNATACTPEGERWKVSGVDLDGDELSAIVCSTMAWSW